MVLGIGRSGCSRGFVVGLFEPGTDLRAVVFPVILDEILGHRDRLVTEGSDPFDTIVAAEGESAAEGDRSTPFGEI